MAQPLRLASLIAILAFPILEIGLLIRAGQWLGFWKLALIVILTAMLGTAVIRRTGLAVLAKARTRMETGGSGIDPLLEGLMQLSAGMLLIFPGLISDALGILLLVPAFRQFLVSTVLPRIFTVRTFGTAHTHATNHRPGRKPGEYETTPDFDPESGDGVTIEGEYERVSEETVDPGRDLKPRSARRSAG